MPAQVVTSKRKAIADSSRTMFIWVAVMSAVAGIATVVAIFLVQQITFKSRVIGEMSKTVDTLKSNNKVATELTQNVKVLETNTALNSIKANDEKALQVIFDALPADRNALAVGASLQQNLLSSVDGLTIDSLTVDSTDSTTTTTLADNTIPFNLQVSAQDVNKIKDLLVNFEKSIRTIDVDLVSIDRGDTLYQATISGHVYYQAEKSVTLGTKTISTKDGSK